MVGAPLAALIVWFAPLPLEAPAQKCLAIVLFMVLLWVTEVMDYGVTALIGAYLFWVLGIAKFSSAFDGFVNPTPWFLFGAMMIAKAASITGLARRIAFTIMSVIGTSFSRLLLGIIIVSCLLNFIIPSGMAQLAAMAPIVLGIVMAFNVPQESNVGRAMFVTITYTSGLFNKMILAGAASVMAWGLMKSIGNVTVFYFDWLVAFLPVIPLTILATWRLVLWLYPPEKRELPEGRSYLKQELDRLGPWSRGEKRAFLFMMLAIVFWVTDRIHHIEPAMIGLGVGLLLCVPGLGVLRTKELKEINYLLIVFLGGALSMGTVMKETKLINVLSEALLHWAEPLLRGEVLSAFVLYWAAFIYHLFMGSELPMVSTSIPVILNLAVAKGWNPATTGMIWVFATAGKIFVYQSSVLVVGYAYGYFKAKDLIRVGGCLTVIECVFLVLLVWLWWPLIGLR
ncbi:MAG: anion permease [Acidobacteria bacterium]|nr:anion permease [Acidobacteriota bacterium]